MMGTTLAMIPAHLESFADFKNRYPDGNVLVPNNPNFRDYGLNPYPGYDSSTVPFLYRGDLPDGIGPMARVIVVKTAGRPPVIVSLALVRERDRLRIGRLLFSWKEGQVSAVDAARIADSRDVGTIEVRDMQSPAGQSLVPYDFAFAFAAHALHPDMEIRQH